MLLPDLILLTCFSVRCCRPNIRAARRSTVVGEQELAGEATANTAPAQPIHASASRATVGWHLAGFILCTIVICAKHTELFVLFLSLSISLFVSTVQAGDADPGWIQRAGRECGEWLGDTQNLTEEDQRPVAA